MTIWQNGWLIILSFFTFWFWLLSLSFNRFLFLWFWFWVQFLFVFFLLLWPWSLSRFWIILPKEKKIIMFLNRKFKLLIIILAVPWMAWRIFSSAMPSFFSISWSRSRSLIFFRYYAELFINIIIIINFWRKYYFLLLSLCLSLLSLPWL